MKRNLFFLGLFGLFGLFLAVSAHAQTAVQNLNWQPVIVQQVDPPVTSATIAAAEAQNQTEEQRATEEISRANSRASAADSGLSKASPTPNNPQAGNSTSAVASRENITPQQTYNRLSNQP